jgi:hypothetical protein
MRLLTFRDFAKQYRITTLLISGHNWPRLYVGNDWGAIEYKEFDTLDAFFGGDVNFHSLVGAIRGHKAIRGQQGRFSWFWPIDPYAGPINLGKTAVAEEDQGFLWGVKLALLPSGRWAATDDCDDGNMPEQRRDENPLYRGHDTIELMRALAYTL